MDIQHHPVIQLIRDRAREQSFPNKRSDAFRLGLVIEGGGMRGVVSAGMVSALQQLGLRDVFDVLYGASAGAINGAYFLARQAPYGTTIYYQDINNSHFISFRRLLGGGPVVSLEYLLDEVMVRRKVLDWEAVLRSDIPLNVAASSLSHRQGVLLNSFGSRDELWEALRASARIPLLAGQPVRFRDSDFLDASLYASIPVDLAVADGCTHLLVLQTRPRGFYRRRSALLERFLIPRFLRRFDAELAAAYLQKPSRYQLLVQRLTELTARPGPIPPYVLAVTPDGDGGEVSQLERDEDKLVAGARAGLASIANLFQASRLTSAEALMLFDGGRATGDKSNEH